MISLRSLRPWVLMLALVGGLSLAPSDANAQQSMTWHVQSLYNGTVELEFYSETRQWAWPGNGRVYVLRDQTQQSFQLSCQQGEKVCFGAWVRGNTSRYWGGGQDNKQACDNCCYLCSGQQTDLRVLRP